MNSIAAAPEDRTLVLEGAWGLARLADLRAALAALPPGATVDLSRATRLDSAAAVAILDEAAARAARGDDLRRTGAGDDLERLFALVAQAGPDRPDPEPAPWRATDALERLGRASWAAGAWAADLLGWLGLSLARLVTGLLRPGRLHLTATVAQMDEAGWRAVPIVTLMSFLIGIVIGYQGASQLRQFGAEIFAVDLIAISVLRELGVLLTAIIVAGRTASAYTAAIGAMKMGEEIDAMRTLGIDPVQALVVPRVVALVVMLPILSLIADLAGLTGGAVMSWASLGISPAMFAARLVEEISVTHVVVGLVKAPVFAVLIALIGCQGGMRVKDDAASLGMTTSASVVAAIFAVIAADALFSVFFAQMGW